MNRRLLAPISATEYHTSGMALVASISYCFESMSEPKAERCNQLQVMYGVDEMRRDELAKA